MQRSAARSRPVIEQPRAVRGPPVSPTPDLGRSEARAGSASPRRRPPRPRPMLLEGLNPPQREAVLHEGAPVLVVAGAGSGKTRVLTRRIAYLGRRAPRRTRARSWPSPSRTRPPPRCADRVLELVGNRAKLMWVSTFHSACVRILRAEIAGSG